MSSDKHETFQWLLQAPENVATIVRTNHVIRSNIHLSLETLYAHGLHMLYARAYLGEQLLKKRREVVITSCDSRLGVPLHSKHRHYKLLIRHLVDVASVSASVIRKVLTSGQPHTLRKHLLKQDRHEILIGLVVDLQHERRFVVAVRPAPASAGVLPFNVVVASGDALCQLV